MTTSVAFILQPRFSLLSLAGALEALTAANDVLDEAAYSGITLSLDGAPVRASCGTLVAVSHGLADAQDVHAAFVTSESPLPDAAQAAIGTSCADSALPLRQALQLQGMQWHLHVGIVDGGAVMAWTPHG